MTAEEKRWQIAVKSVDHCVLCRSPRPQWSHSNQGRGKSQKAPPIETAALCETCHHEIDNGTALSKEARRAIHDRAIVLTHTELWLRGLLVLRNPPKPAIESA